MRNPSLAPLLALVAGCSQPITPEWTWELEAASVSTPLVTDSFIAVGHELGVSIIEPDGTPRCTFTTHRDVISAPKTDGQRIFFGATNYIFYAIDSGCTEQWKFPTGDRIKSDPLVGDGRVYVSSYDGHLYALAAATGRRLWVFPSPPEPDLGLPPEPEVKPVVAKVAATRAKSGKEADAAAEPEAESAPALPPQPTEVGDFSYSSPVLADNVVYLGNLDQHLYAIDADDGTMRWRFKTDGPVTSTPLVHGKLVYFGSNDGNLYALDRETQKLRWTFTTKDWVNSSPRLADGVLYIGSNDRHVYAIDAQSGKLEWKHELEGPAIAIPAVYKNLVIAAGGSGDGNVYALQREDGTRFWRYGTGNKIESDPVVVGDRLFVSSADRVLYAFGFRRTRAD